MKNKMLSKNSAKKIMITAGSVYAAAISTACLRRLGQIVNAGQKEENSINGRCPVCDSPVLKTDGHCGVCGINFHACPSCGTLLKDTYAFCKKCGMENELTKYNYINGTAYPAIRREPDPKMYVTYEYCSCGVPFEEDARYCQFCGKIRPKKGKSYRRKDIPQ